MTTHAEHAVSNDFNADEKGKEAKLFYRDIEEQEYVNPNKFIEGYRFFNKKYQKIKNPSSPQNQKK